MNNKSQYQTYEYALKLIRKAYEELEAILDSDEIRVSDECGEAIESVQKTLCKLGVSMYEY